MGQRYLINPDGTAITCQRCGLVSYHPQDIAARYCGNCRMFHEMHIGEGAPHADSLLRTNADLRAEIARLQTHRDALLADLTEIITVADALSMAVSIALSASRAAEIDPRRKAYYADALYVLGQACGAYGELRKIIYPGAGRVRSAARGVDYRYITGIYVRIQRDGRWEPIDIAALTDAELDAFFSAADPDRSRKFALGLAKWIRDHVVVTSNPDYAPTEESPF